VRDNAAPSGTSRAIALSRRTGGASAMTKDTDLDDIENSSEPANLRFLRQLVTALTATMILGVLTVIVLLVIRLNTPDNTLTLPDRIILPNGTIATSFTVGSDWYAVVTQDDEILIFDQLNGTLRRTIILE
jgi:hypothetical protein